MGSINEWFTFEEGTVDKKTCNKIKKWASKKWETGIADWNSDSRYRISDVAWCNDQWLYDVIWPIMQLANDEAGWRYQIKSAETNQITRYKKGGFYNWLR